MCRDKILIIRAGALGDTLMLMPLIKVLRRDYEIIVLGRRPGIDYLEPYTDKCIDIERGGWHQLFNNSAGDIPVPQVNYVTAFINDRENIVYGNLNHLFSGSKINIFPPFPDINSQVHVALHMAYGFKSSGIPLDFMSGFDRAFREPLMDSRINEGGKKIVLHPGSGSKKKNYSPKFWFDLLIHIKMTGSLESKVICILTGPAEEDNAGVFKEYADRFMAELYICPDREELLTILNNTCLYIGHDSGVTHLAAMLGIHTIAFFKNSSIEQWHPLGPSVKVIGPDENPDRILKNIAGEIQAMFCRRP